MANLPTSTIVKSSGTGPLSTTSTALRIPLTNEGYKPSLVRIAISAGSAHVRLGTDTSVTAVTSDTLVNAGEALWTPTLGLNAVAVRQSNASAGTAGVSMTIGSLEDGVLIPSPTSIG